MAPPPIRIAILEADIPLDKTRAKYGSYSGVFTSLLYKAVDTSDIPRERLEITAWNIMSMEDAKEGEEEAVGGMWNIKRRTGYPKMESIDAILITGSRFNAFDHDPWIVRLVDFVQEVLAQGRVKIIGVCYGHQIVGRALGAKVARSESGAWEVSVCRVTQTDTGKELFGGKDSLSIHQMHKDHVHHLPLSPLPGGAHVRGLGSSPPCKVQGMYLPGRLLTVQGHPEFDAELVEELLAKRLEQGVFSREVYEEAMGRVEWASDGVLVARGFLRFLGLG